MMLGPVTLTMYIISSTCVKVALGISWYESMIIGACVTPTDPVLANSVIKGKFANRYIPTHMRNLLAVESGGNDGLGLPFLMLPVFLMFSGSKVEALAHWAIHTWIYEIFFSILLGAGCGVGARWLLRQSEKRNLIDKDSFLVFTIALTLLVTGIAALISTDDLLAVFIAGNAFAWDEKFLIETHNSDISEVIDMLFNFAYFVIFGSMIPWQAFRDYGIGRLCLMSGLILLFRRLPIVMALRPWMPVLQNRKQAFFAGWFGPMGVGAIFFSLIAKNIFEEGVHGQVQVQTNIAQIVFPVVAFVVLSSIIIHGITVPMTNFHMKKRAKLKSRRVQKMREQMVAVAGESVPDKEVIKAAAAVGCTSPVPHDDDGGDEEWEYYTDYEDVDELDGDEDDLIVGRVPEQITVIIDGVESVQETVRPGGFRRKVRKRRPVGSPSQSTVTSFSEMMQESDNQDTVMSADFTAVSMASPSHNNIS